MEKIDVISKEEMILLSNDELTKLKYGLFRVAKTIAWENEVVHDLPDIVKERNKAALDELSQLMKMLE